MANDQQVPISLEDKRLTLHSLLTTMLDEGSIHYQPDSNVRLSYPCITYMFDKPVHSYANNIKFISFYRFTITLITDDATDPLYDKLQELFTFENQYVLDGLYHSVFITNI